jgi:hypothetical protein
MRQKFKLADVIEPQNSDHSTAGGNGDGDCAAVTINNAMALVGIPERCVYTRLLVQRVVWCELLGMSNCYNEVQ